MLTNFLFNFSLPFATVGLLAFVLYTYRRAESHPRSSKLFAVATLSSFISFVCVTALLVTLFIEHGAESFTLHATREILYAWVIMVVYFVAEFRYRIRLLGSILMPVALLLLVLAVFEPQTPVQSMALEGIPTILHVALVLVSFAILFLSFAAATLYLFKARALKHSPGLAMDDELPAVTTLKKLMRTTFQAAFPLFTLGMLLGAIYAGATLSPGWYLHPFMLMAGGIWCLYAGLFWLQHRRDISSLVFARLVVVLFVLVVVLAIFSRHRDMLEDSQAPAPPASEVQ